ncbi:MAG: gamma-glutamyltransferase family protein [Alphaproteobacteria bacterium]|nr:gamma-glutamyltransferase family protein [Alphaproteobacteria bacterium]
MRDFHQPRRSPAIAGEAMAATSHPLATLTAVEVLRGGGNAVDAAIAASAVLCVAEPQMTGVGGDCFVLYSPRAGAPKALNGSGGAPAKAVVSWYAERGFKDIPSRSPHAVTVPGAVDAWVTLHAAHGSKDWAALLAPAIRLAETGVRLAPRVAFDFAFDHAQFDHDADAVKVLKPGGKLPGVGDVLKFPALAATLKRIAHDGRKGFYEGPVAQDIVRKLNAVGGLHTLEDFAVQRAEWTTAISTDYRGCDVFECPPNGQGLAALMMLRVFAGYELGEGKLSTADRIHLLAETAKAAYAERDTVFGDPRQVKVPVERLLSEDWARAARAAIRMDRAGTPASLEFAEHKHTIYLCVVDRDRNCISFINSLFDTFGTGIMAPESGVLLHSRGKIFRTVAGHPNAIAPGKRPLHTIIPGMLMKDGRATMPFGVMGGHYQANGHTHFLSQILDRGMDPQAAAEEPRSFAIGGVLQLERGIGDEIVADLARRGHKIVRPGKPLGGAQAIRIDHARGTLTGGSDPRKDGCALGY